ncbi:MAG: DMT family transporter [bacterium]|nr:DMT family transporter [bacterium]
MDTKNRYYQYSGVFTFQGILFMVILGAVGAAVLSALYGYGTKYIPFIYVNVLLTVGLGILVGALVGKGAKWGNVRKPGLATIFGIVFGIVAEYGGWVAWFYAVTEQKILVLSPKILLAAIGATADTGAWTIFGWTPTGWALYIVWFIEAFLIIGLAGVAASTVASEPYCETCSKWLDKKESLPERIAVSDPDALKTQLENGDYKALTDLKPVMTHKVSCYSAIEVLMCDKCLNLYLLDVKTVEKGTDKKGEETNDEETIVSNLIIDSYTYNTLKKVPEPAKAPEVKETPEPPAN